MTVDVEFSASPNGLLADSAVLASDFFFNLDVLSFVLGCDS